MSIDFTRILPSELIIAILKYLPTMILFPSERVSKKWKDNIANTYTAKLPPLLQRINTNLHEIESIYESRLLPNKALCLVLEGLGDNDLAILNQRMTPARVKEFLCVNTLRKTNTAQLSDVFIPHANLLSHVIIAHNMTLLKDLIEVEGLKPTLHTLNVAAGRQNNNLYIIQYLVKDRGIQPDQSTLLQATQSGDVKKLEYFYYKTHIGQHIESFYHNQYLQSGIKRQLKNGEQIEVSTEIQRNFFSFLQSLWGKALESSNLKTVKFIYNTIINKASEKDKNSILFQKPHCNTAEIFDFICQLQNPCIQWKQRSFWYAIKSNNPLLEQHIANHLRQIQALTDEPLITQNFIDSVSSPMLSNQDRLLAVFDFFNIKWVNYGIDNEINIDLQKENVLLQIIETGNIELLGYLINTYHTCLPEGALVHAIEHQQMNSIQFILDNTDQKLTHSLLENVIQNNHIQANTACYLLKNENTLKFDLSILRTQLPSLLGNANAATLKWALEHNIAPTQEAALTLILDHIDPRLHAFLNQNKTTYPVKETISNATLDDMETPFFNFLNPDASERTREWVQMRAAQQTDAAQPDFSVTKTETCNILKQATRPLLLNFEFKHQLIKENYLEPSQDAFKQLAQAEMLDTFWLLLEKTTEDNKRDCINVFCEHLLDQDTITQQVFDKLKIILGTDVSAPKIRVS